MNYFNLLNGQRIPAIGFGTWQTPDGETAVHAVKTAIEAGYTHIDTAAVYGNEASVGQAIRETGVARENLYITTKLWNTERGYETTLKAFADSCAKLGVDYVDLYLIHWPANALQFPDNWQAINAETWRAFEDLYEAGKIKAIGVSNFMVHHLQALKQTARIQPMVNQIEFHPGYTQAEVVDYCNDHSILVEAWSPLGSGRLLEHPTLQVLAEKYGISVAQLCMQFALQQGVLPLVKSITAARIIANIEPINCTLDESDIKAMAELQENGFSGLNPDQVPF